MTPDPSSGKAGLLRRLHVPGRPLLLHNIWDAASARIIAKAGAKAIATSSAAVAVSHGYGDGELLPLELLVSAVRRIAEATPLPTSADVEMGYGVGPGEVRSTARRIAEAGAVGINIEDRSPTGPGLRDASEQCDRIAAAITGGRDAGVDLVVNARTDVFLDRPAPEHGPAECKRALERARAYAAAGATSFFVPGLMDLAMIAEICRLGPLPVNVMLSPGQASPTDLAKAGVARVSGGFVPMQQMMAHLAKDAGEFLKALPS